MPENNKVWKMINDEQRIDDQDIKPKLYSQKAFGIATFLGGPLAAGVLARQNFKTLGNDDYAKLSLIIGVVSTILIFVGLAMVPENSIDKIPNAILPAIYTAIIYFIIEKLQGKQLEEHKKNNGVFYSNWKATGIGAICLAILSAGIVGYVYSENTGFDAQKYDDGIALITKNEEQALRLFTIIENSSQQQSINFIDNFGIPAWQSNLKILEGLDKMEGLYDELSKQNQILKNYCKLRIESYQLIRKALIENTSYYDAAIQSINEKIDREVEKLK
jgi:hypothetical protein